MRFLRSHGTLIKMGTIKGYNTHLKLKRIEIVQSTFSYHSGTNLKSDKQKENFEISEY